MPLLSGIILSDCLQELEKPEGKNEDKLGKTFVDSAKEGLIMQAFDQIIGLESGKIKKKNANIVGGG